MVFEKNGAYLSLLNCVNLIITYLTSMFFYMKNSRHHHYLKMLISCLAIDDSAVYSDLSGGASERVYIDHLDHCHHEIDPEEFGVLDVELHQHLRPAAEQLLIGVEQAAPRHQVLVVGGIERRQGLYVHGWQDAIAAGLWARPLLLLREGRVECWTRCRCGYRRWSTGLANGVGAGESRNVPRRREAGVGGWCFFLFFTRDPLDRFPLPR
jgi:hypothetical protein